MLLFKMFTYNIFPAGRAAHLQDVVVDIVVVELRVDVDVQDVHLIIISSSRPGSPPPRTLLW